LNEYLLLKEEQQKKLSFAQSFGKDPIIKTTLTKLSTLLDDFLSYRKTYNEGTHQDNVVMTQHAEPVSRVTSQSTTKSRSRNTDHIGNQSEKGLASCG
jgi:hypothetical protein